MGEFEIDEASICTECGSPSHAGHTQTCPRGFPVEEALEGSDGERKFFELYRKEHGYTKPYNESIEPHLFVIQDMDKEIIAGEVVEIQQAEQDKEKKKAYFRMKVVAPSHRNKGLMERIEKVAIQAAIEAGCDEAWAVAGSGDPKAMRSLIKSGFLILGRARKIMREKNAQEDEYYFSRDLTTEPRAVSSVEAMNAPVVQDISDLGGETLLIPYQHETLTDAALSQGYIGKQLFLPKDWPATAELGEVFQKETLYFEKIQTKE